MDFLVFQIVFALLVVVLLATMVLIIRSAWRARAVRPRRPATGGQGARAAARGEPSEEPAVAKTARRRQIVPAALREGEGEPLLAIKPHGETAPCEPEPLPPPSPDQPTTEPEQSFHETVMAALEQAFERYDAGQITLAAYTDLIVAEREAVETRIAALQDRPCADDAARIALEEETDDARCASDAIHWCLEWAEGLARSGQPA